MIISKKTSWFFVLIIVFLAFLVRFHNIDKEDIWLDEAYSLYVAEQPSFVDLINNMSTYEDNPPLYYISLHYWIKLFGNSETAVRALSLFLGLGSIILLYMLASLLFDRKTGLLSAFFMFFSLIQTVYSQEARAYMLLVFLTLLSTLLFVRLLKKRTWFNQSGYILFTALLLYTHYLSFFVIFFQNIIFFLFYPKKEFRKWVAYQFLILLLYVPWLPFFYNQFSSIHNSLKIRFLYKLGMPYFIGNLGVFLFAIPLLLLFVIGIWLYVAGLNKKIVPFIKKIHVPDYLLIFFIGIFIVSYFFFISKLITPIFFTRYPIFLFFLFYIALSRILLILKNKKIALVLFLLLIFLNTFALYSYKISPDKKEPWSKVDSIISASDENSAILFFWGASQLPFDYYYRGDSTEIQLKRGTEEEMNAHVSSVKEELLTYDSWWLILSHSYDGGEFYKDKLSDLNADYSITSSVSFNGIELINYKKNEINI
jgi:mannosyltransferase